MGGMPMNKLHCKEELGRVQINEIGSTSLHPPKLPERQQFKVQSGRGNFNLPTKKEEQVKTSTKLFQYGNDISH